MTYRVKSCGENIPMSWKYGKSLACTCVPDITAGKSVQSSRNWTVGDAEVNLASFPLTGAWTHSKDIFYNTNTGRRKETIATLVTGPVTIIQHLYLNGSHSNFTWWWSILDKGKKGDLNLGLTYYSEVTFLLFPVINYFASDQIFVAHCPTDRGDLHFDHLYVCGFLPPCYWSISKILLVLKFSFYASPKHKNTITFGNICPRYFLILILVKESGCGMPYR